MKNEDKKPSLFEEFITAFLWMIVLPGLLFFYGLAFGLV